MREMENEKMENEKIYTYHVEILPCGFIHDNTPVCPDWIWGYTPDELRRIVKAAYKSDLTFMYFNITPFNEGTVWVIGKKEHDA